MNVLILSGVAWNDTFQRHHQVALELAERGYDVYFISHIPSSAFSINKIVNRIKNKGKNIENVDNNSYILDNIYIIQPQLLFPGLLTNHYNKYKINRVFKNIPRQYDVVFVYVPVSTTLYFLSKLSYKKLIYDCVRYFQNWGGYQKNISCVESEILSKSDFILCDSYFLKQHLENKCKQKSKIYQILPQINERLTILPRKHIKQIKSIGYIGTFSYHNDIVLIKQLLSHYTVYLYGKNEVSDLDNYDNFKYKGYYTDLKALQLDVRKDCDAIIIPYIGNMDGVIPAKLPLCITIGLPIFINSFYDSIYLSNMMYH